MVASAARLPPLDRQEAAPSRAQVLARYRRLREISKRHNAAILKLISGDAVMRQARRLGMAAGGKIILDRIEDFYPMYDLAIYTAPADRSRAVDRYARSAQVGPGSDEALMLDAMRNARFSVLKVQRRHPVAGLIVTDLFRDIDLWLVDEGLEISARVGQSFATRLFAPGHFVMTAGVLVPFGENMLADVVDAAPQLLRKSPEEVVGDRRFAEAVYGVALADGMMGRVAYQDPGDVGDSARGGAGGSDQLGADGPAASPHVP